MSCRRAPTALTTSPSSACSSQASSGRRTAQTSWGCTTRSPPPRATSPRPPSRSTTRTRRSGSPAGQVESTQTPEPGVTIVRDKQYGVPHIYGDTRPELMFGIGYATAEDRLFMIDALRHSGRGRPGQLRGRGERGHGRVRLAGGALHPPGPRQPGRQHPLRTRRRAALRRRHQLRQRHQRLHRRGQAAPQHALDDARRVRGHRPARRPGAVHARGPRLDRHARRWHLRQRRRRPALQRPALPGDGQEVRP